MNKALLILLSFALFFSVSAEQHNKRNAISPPIVKLSNPKLKPIVLSELTIESEVISNIATSTYELVFYNPNNRVLEGELIFSLYDGQNIINYALQIKGKYRQASVVPKAKAKEAYEETVRAQIDPSILEKTIGNNFKTRLYPIPAKGYKRIKLTLQEVLESKGNTFQFRIPLITKHMLKKLKVAINFPSLKEQPRSNFKGFKFDSASQGQTLNFEKINTPINKPIAITFTGSTQQEIFSQTIAHENFVFASIPLKKKLARSQRTTPKRIAIVWNNSLSNSHRIISKEIQFLNNFFQKSGKTSVQLVMLNNHITQKNLGIICAHNAACKNKKTFGFVRKQLTNSRFNGTSDYSKLDINTLNVDEVLMFSNGIKTIHEAAFRNINKPITTINTSLKADTNQLKRIARKSNGRFIDLSKISPSEAIAQFLSKQTRIKVIGSSKNFNKQNIFATLQNNRINISAKANNTASGWIQLALNNQNQTVQYTVKINAPIAVKQNLASLWASHKITELSFNPKKNKTTIINLAKNYKVLTKDMSLIVLDRVQDYVRYEISPPAELREKYSQLLKKKVNKKLYEKEQALIESITLLQKQKIWYQKAFPKTKPVPKKKKIARDNEASQGAISSEAEAPIVVAPAPAMAPRPSPARRVSVAKPFSSKSVTKKATIKLKKFNPNAIYIKKIKQQDKSKWLKTYFTLMKTHVDQPMFYVDVADLFYKNDLKKEALIILSNLLELDLDNSEFLRVFALKAMEFGEYHLAIKAFEKVKELRPFEPQSFRDLALAYDKNKQHQKAANTLYFVLTHTWDSRFSGIKIVIINELNNILARNKIDKHTFDTRLISKIPVDLRVVINWSSDNTDIDLWVVDPYKEKTFYSNKVSRIGGKISNDITQGYGPEEFMIKDAVDGKYIIQANYYGNSQQKSAIPVTIRAKIFSNYSKGNEQEKEIVLRLKNKKAIIDIGEYLYQ